MKVFGTMIFAVGDKLVNPFTEETIILVIHHKAGVLLGLHV